MTWNTLDGQEGDTMEDTGDPQWITIRQAAEVMAVSSKTIQRYLAKGLLSRVKEGKRTLLLQSEVEALRRHPVHGKGPAGPEPPLQTLMGQSGDIVVIGRDRYDELIAELTALRGGGKVSVGAAPEVIDRRDELGQLREELEAIRVMVMELDKQVDALRQEWLKIGSSGRQSGDAGGPAGKKPWWQV